jgi:superfamily II DNA or RNA helicase
MPAFAPGSTERLILRSYQERLHRDVRQAFRDGHRRVLLQAPTGSGKTVTFAHIGALAQQRGHCVLVVVHRRELVDQVAATFAQFGVEAGIIARGYPESDPAAAVKIALIDTLKLRVAAGQHLAAYDLVVVDEAHHATAAKWFATVPNVIKPNGFILGCSATPRRLDGAPLSGCYDSLVVGPEYHELYSAGALVRAVTYAPKSRLDLTQVATRGGDYVAEETAKLMADRSIVGDVVGHYRRLVGRRPAIAYCCTIQHSKLVAEQLREAGYNALHVDGRTNDETRRMAIAGLANGGFDVLTNVNLFAEGVDVPVLYAVLLLRPTKSLTLYRQMCGRAVRMAPGKTGAVIVDHAGCSMRHGLYDDVVLWSLSGARPKDPDEAPVRPCPFCEAVIPAASRRCPVCGHVLVAESGERSPVPRHRHEQLEPLQVGSLQWLAVAPYEALLQWAAGDLQRLHQIQSVRGYADYWVTARREDWARRPVLQSDQV